MSIKDTIEHQPEHNQFVYPISEGIEARIKYRLDNERIDFYSTFVPPEARGKGIAEALVRQALDWAKSEQLQVLASCWYVQKFL